MFRSALTTRFSHLLLTSALVLLAVFQVMAQNSLTGGQPRHSVSVLDSTKEQDGLVGSVRRVKTETAKVDTKAGQLVEGPLQLLELTTYSLKGNRVENTSYPGPDPLVGKEEYKYDSRGNITEMTLRDERGAIVSREAYSYEFDNVGNWTKMTTSLILFENGQIKREPIESTYRTITYYFDDNIAKIVDSPTPTAPRVTLPSAGAPSANVDQLAVQFRAIDEATSDGAAAIGEAPALLVSPPVKAVVSYKTVEPRPTSNVISTNGDDKDRMGQPRAGKRGSFSESRTPVKEPALEGKPKTASASSVAEPLGSTVAVKSPEAAEDSPEKIAYTLYEKGRTSFESGDLQAAIGAFQMSVNFAPSAEVYLNLGFAYAKLDKNNDAAKAFRQSTKLNPNNAEAQYGLGLSSFRLKRFADARDAFKKAISLEPKMAKAHYGLGLTYQELGQPDATTVEVRILETLDKNLAKQLTGSFSRLKDPCRTSMVCQ